MNFYKNLVVLIKNPMENEIKNKTDETPGSRPRPDADRPLDAEMLKFDLNSVTARIKKEDDWQKDDHNAITLMKSEKMRIVLIAMHAGSEIKMHKSEGPISVHILEGKLKFKTEKESVILSKGELLTLHENISHSLSAIDETSFLLTLVKKIQL